MVRLKHSSRSNPWCAKQPWEYSQRHQRHREKDYARLTQRNEVIYDNPTEQANASYYRCNFLPSKLQCWWQIAGKEINWRKSTWENGDLPRKTAWFVESGCSCSYKYSGVVSKPTTFPEWLLEITKSVMKEIGWPKKFKTLPNSCNVNWYEDGKSHVGWHRDDENIFRDKDGCSIVSLSLGATRTFQIRHRWKKDILIEKKLHSGDILTMEGKFQDYLVHRVPVERTVKDSRINFTWRWIKNHEQTCRKGDVNQTKAWAPSDKWADIVENSP